MQNPKQQLEEYLVEITKKMKWIISKMETYRYLRECEDTPRVNEFAKHSAFWGNVITALDTDLFINLATLFDERSERNLVDYLTQVKKHCRSLVSANRVREFEAAVDEQFTLIANTQSAVNTLMTHRDKYYAHWDKKYFGEPDRLTTDHPINLNELDELINTARRIVEKQYSLIFNAHYEITPVNSGDVKTVIRNLITWNELASKVRETREGEKYLHDLLMRHTVS